MKLEGLSILGEQRTQPTAELIQALNPATGERLEPPYAQATANDVDNAARLADAAFNVYRRWSGGRKAAFLRSIATQIDANAELIQTRAHQETALPLPRLQGETARTCGQLRLFASLVEKGSWLDARIDHGDEDRTPLPRPDVRSMLAPLGPVVVFSSSNFPLAFSVAGGDTASALAAGCPVIVKPHHGHPGTSELVGLCIQRAAKECGAPDGVFSMLFGPGRATGVALVNHPLIKAVGFTGSSSGGRALMDAAANRQEPIPVYAEMGSINPVLLLPGAVEKDPEALAEGLHASVTLGVGQFCTNPGLVFVTRGERTDAFLRQLGERLSGSTPGTMLTSNLRASYCAGIHRMTNLPNVERTAYVETGGGAGEADAGAALLVTDAKTFVNEHSLREEVFGPSTIVVRCDSVEEMRSAVLTLEGQLTATIHGTPDELATHSDLVAALERKAGRLLFNGFPTGVEVCHAMTHGGPYPATSDGRSTSVGTRAIERFTRPVCFQNWPDVALPDELKESNPLNLWRLVDGELGQH